MKTEEDEAFDDLARKQGAWGGGFKAKQAMAADKQKLWDKPSVAFDEWWNGDNDESTNPFRLESGAYWAWAGWKAALAQSAQEPVECLDCGSPNVGVPANYDSLVDSVKAQPAQEPVAWEQFYPDIGKPQIALNAEVVGYVAPHMTEQNPIAQSIDWLIECGWDKEQATNLAGAIKADSPEKLWEVAPLWLEHCGDSMKYVNDMLGSVAMGLIEVTQGADGEWLFKLNDKGMGVGKQLNEEQA